MDIPSISGHCTRRRALECRDVSLFTMDGRTYAVIVFSDADNTWGLYLVVSDEEYDAWGKFFLNLVPKDE